MKSGSKNCLQRAFSLLELLVVLAVLTILMGLSISRMSGVSGSIELSTTAAEVADLFHRGRQEALLRNRDVQVRIYETGDPLFPDTKGFRRFAIGMVELEDEAANATQVSFTKIAKDYLLPVSVQLLDSPEYSTLITGQSNADKTILTGEEEVGGVLTRYVAVPFSPNNRARLSTDLDWTLTLVNSAKTANDIADKLPQNFIALQLLPGTGKVRFIQP